MRLAAIRARHLKRCGRYRYDKRALTSGDPDSVNTAAVKAPHTPVMLDEVLAGLNVHAAGFYVDATFGRGGHSAAILAQMGDAGQVLALDRDPAAVAWAAQQFADDNRIQVVQGSFSHLQAQVETVGMQGKVNGVLLDLGVSSPQFDDPARGFSFQHDGPLDMRMDPTSGVSAADWLNNAEPGDIVHILKRYGEEPQARRIVRALLATRPLHTTAELAALIAEVAPAREPGRHPATKTFQAIRIYINQELQELEAVLPQALAVLAPAGRLVVISFHSLEDRIVKRFLREQSRGDPFPPDLPVPASALQPTLKLVGGAQRASTVEVSHNPRARSAVLRVAERLAA